MRRWSPADVTSGVPVDDDDDDDNDEDGGGGDGSGGGDDDDLSMLISPTHTYNLLITRRVVVEVFKMLLFFSENFFRIPPRGIAVETQFELNMDGQMRRPGNA